MSTSNCGGTKRTRSWGSGEGAPANSYKRPKLNATSQQTADPLFKMGGWVSTSEDQEEQVDLKGIRDQVWLTNMNQLFPEEVWELVMGKLKKKADIDNCSNASPFFGKLLQKKREREVVLPIIFGILAKKYCDKNNKDESYLETNVESIPWEIGSEEPHRMTGLWKCRLVSKKWNKVIEDLHQNEAAGHYQMDSDDDLNSAEKEELGSKWGTERFDFKSDIDNFLDHFQATHFDLVRLGRVSGKCPISGRAVQIISETMDEGEEIDQAYWNKLMETMEKFGDQVWYLKSIWGNRGGLVDFYQKLKQIVKLVPNLKVLLVSPFACQSKELLGLEEEMLRNPFPERTNLEMISVTRIPGVLCNHLVHQNRHISRLEINGIDFNGNSALFTKILPNLNQLSLEGVNSLEIIEAFERYPAVLNLKSLKIWEISDEPFVPWSSLFNAIGSKVNSETCTNLQLGMPYPESDLEKMSVLQDSQECRLPLANIQRCKIHNFAFFFLDFLLPSKKCLREMDIQTWRVIPKFLEREEQVIKFVGYEDKMEESNIATELPALRKLTVNTGRNGHDGNYSIQPNGVVQVDVRKKSKA